MPRTRKPNNSEVLQHGILHFARLLSIKNSPPQPPVVQWEYWRPGPPPFALTHRPATLIRAERWLSSDAASVQSSFAPKGYLEKPKQIPEFPL